MLAFEAKDQKDEVREPFALVVRLITYSLYRISFFFVLIFENFVFRFVVDELVRRNYFDLLLFIYFVSFLVAHSLHFDDKDRRATYEFDLIFRVFFFEMIFDSWWRVLKEQSAAAKAKKNSFHNC